MKEKFKNQKGITLVALVITIIILLILAMVSISLVMNTGIINRANNAVQAYNEAQINELQKLNEIENEMKKYPGQTPTPSTNKDWAKLTEEEKVALQNAGHYDGEIYYFLGDSGGDLGSAVEGGALQFDTGTVKENGKTYLFTSEDTEFIESLSTTSGEKVEKNTWYSMPHSSAWTELEKYNGEFPLNTEELAKLDIYCESYWQRLIDNFNK